MKLITHCKAMPYLRMCIIMPPVPHTSSRCGASFKQMSLPPRPVTHIHVCKMYAHLWV